MQAEAATGSEADALEALVGRARFAGHAALEVRADAGYAGLAGYAKLEALKATALIPPQPGARHPAARAARERMRTPAGRDSAIDRQTHAEGAIAELKHHGMRRSRCRGTRKTQLQLLAAATAINLKQPVKRPRRPIGRSEREPGPPVAPFCFVAGLLLTLSHRLAEIDRPDAVDSSTGS